jgi:predicted acyl esterase
MHLLANISLDTPDGDVGAKVGAILPDGRTLVLGQDMVGARFRHGVDKPRLATPGAIEPWRFDGFYFTVRELPKDTRLRPALAPLNTPDLQKNFNSGGRIGYGTAGTRGPRLFPSTSIHGTRVISNCRWRLGSRSRNDEAVLAPMRIFVELH